MRYFKTLGLAAVTVLSLGSVAMAQEGGGPSMPTIDYWAAKAIATEQAAGPARVQAGSSDVNTVGRGARAHIDYSVLANPG